MCFPSETLSNSYYHHHNSTTTPPYILNKAVVPAALEGEINQNKSGKKEKDTPLTNTCPLPHTRIVTPSTAAWANQRKQVVILEVLRHRTCKHHQCWLMPVCYTPACSQQAYSCVCVCVSLWLFLLTGDNKTGWGVRLIAEALSTSWKPHLIPSCDW